MALDLDEFTRQCFQLIVSRYWMRWGLDLVRDSPHFLDHHRRAGPFPTREETKGMSFDSLRHLAEDLERAKAQTTHSDAVHREMLDRITYVYLWAALEHLVTSCAVEVYRTEPKRLLRGSEPTTVHLEVTRHLLTNAWSREDVVADLIERERKAIGATPFRKLPDYFASRLGIAWRHEWTSDLSAICDRRNEAAHALTFTPPGDETLNKDLETVRLHGQALARFVAKEHKLELIDNAPPPKRSGARKKKG